MEFKNDKKDFSISFFPSEEDGLGFVYQGHKQKDFFKKAVLKIGIASIFLGFVSYVIFTPPKDEFTSVPEEMADEENSELAPLTNEVDISEADLTVSEDASMSLAALTSSSVTSVVPVSDNGNITESKMVDITADSALNGKEVVATVHSGDNLISLLKRNGIGNRDAFLISTEMDKIYPVKNLRPKQTVSIYKNKDNAFSSLVIKNKNGDNFSVVKDETGAFLALTTNAKIEIRKSRISGKIQKTFSQSAAELNISSSIVSQISKAFSDAINFRTDCRRGDTFELVFEERFNEEGENIGGNKLLFATVSIGGKRYNRYYFKGNGVEGWFDEKGNKTKQAINVKPIGDKRISSRFGMRRHPILLYPIFHSGIDFATSIGTPVPAAADGKIVYIGTKGGYGKYVQIKHGSGYSTAYAHLNGYNKNLKVGSLVKQGDIIAYSGNTGRSTGPHLHFEIIKNGKKVDPLQKGKFYITEKLQGKTLKKFYAQVDNINKSYNVAQKGF
jgi:murein DD-endopeptidase MepM/ murein hydrolase activator NlpD